MTTLVEKLPEVWQAQWGKLGFTSASPIQDKGYEPLLAGENLVGVSPTGSGKTLAYLLPLLQTIEKGAGNQLLILLPSQELAVQVASVTKEWADLLGLNSQALVGGANVKRQIEKLKTKPEVLVGTPGRVIELIKGKKVKAHLLKTLVLDEVDQLIETSELNASATILKSLDRDAQLVCVSATAVAIEEKLGELNKREMTILDVTDEDQSAGTVEHGYIVTPPRKRVEVLRKLSHIKGFKAIVFFNEVQEMGFVSEKLEFLGVPNATLASDQNKMERRLALSAFADNKLNLLLTTDIAARGLDFDALPYVIHYDVPYTLESYVHRSGRTGRMGHDGHILSLVDDYSIRDLKKIAKQKEWPLSEKTVHSSQIVTQEKRVVTEGETNETDGESGTSDKPARKPKGDGEVKRYKKIKTPAEKKSAKKKTKTKTKNKKNDKNKGARKKSEK